MQETTGETPSPAAALPDTINIGGVVYRRTGAPPGHRPMAVHYKDRRQPTLHVYIGDEVRADIAVKWTQGCHHISFMAIPIILTSEGKRELDFKRLIMLDFDGVEAIV